MRKYYSNKAILIYVMFLGIPSLSCCGTKKNIQHVNYSEKQNSGNEEKKARKEKKMDPGDYLSQKGYQKTQCPLNYTRIERDEGNLASSEYLRISQAKEIGIEKRFGYLPIFCDSTDGGNIDRCEVSFFPENSLEYILKTGENCYRTSDITVGMEENLKRMEEPSMMKDIPNGIEVYRLYYSGVSFSPTLIRIEKNSDSITIIKKTLESDRVKTSSYTVYEKQFEIFRDMLDRSDYWNMYPRPIKFGADGNVWLLEGNNSRIFQYVYRWSPKENGYFMTLCKMLMRMVGELKD